MKRGLKDHNRRGAAHGGVVTTVTPMKRGLKDESEKILFRLR